MSDELDALRKASDGLLYPSETDSPFEVFTWPAATTARDALMSQVKPKGKIEEVSLDAFFNDLKHSDDNSGFEKLRQTISTSLTDVHVFRMGEVEVNIYMVGKMKSGVMGGVRTKSVET